MGRSVVVDLKILFFSFIYKRSENTVEHEEGRQYDCGIDFLTDDNTIRRVGQLNMLLQVIETGLNYNATKATLGEEGIVVDGGITSMRARIKGGCHKR